MRLCDEAFTPRELHGIGPLQLAATINHGSVYKTTPLRDALRKSLGEEYLFGGKREGERPCHVNVAVTSTDETGKKAIILANYSRFGESRANHEFHRPDHPSLEMKTWEAAAATSAAPPFFKAFEHGRTNRSYLDGAIYNNNPIKVVHRERKYLWPDVSELHPDILLSLGTGRDNQIRNEVDKTLKYRPQQRQVFGRICNLLSPLV
jgi:predicted acylesterase/phospholipase RssA